MNINQLKQIADAAEDSYPKGYVASLGPWVGPYIETFNPQRVRAMLDVIEAANTYRNRAMQAGIWYIGMGCEFAEDVDDALKALEEIK